MTDKTYRTNKTDREKRTDKSSKTHGGYRSLRSFQTATVIYDLTVEFVKRYVDPRSRTRDQMIQAARSGRQNIAEGSQASVTSKKTEIKLVGVARASLEELLVDYEDFLRQRGLRLWAKDSPEAKEARALTYKTDRTYETYLTDRERAANCLVCLIHQANYLLDRQIAALEEAFLRDGGYTENLYKRRMLGRGRL